MSFVSQLRVRLDLLSRIQSYFENSNFSDLVDNLSGFQSVKRDHVKTNMIIIFKGSSDFDATEAWTTATLDRDHMMAYIVTALNKLTGSATVTVSLTLRSIECPDGVTRDRLASLWPKELTLVLPEYCCVFTMPSMLQPIAEPTVEVAAEGAGSSYVEIGGKKIVCDKNDTAGRTRREVVLAGFASRTMQPIRWKYFTVPQSYRMRHSEKGHEDVFRGFLMSMQFERGTTLGMEGRDPEFDGILSLTMCLDLPVMKEIDKFNNFVTGVDWKSGVESYSGLCMDDFLPEGTTIIIKLLPKLVFLLPKKLAKPNLLVTTLNFDRLRLGLGLGLG